MSYFPDLVTFKIEHDACLSVEDEVKPKVLNINVRCNARKIFRSSPIFKHGLVSSFSSRGPLNCVLREDPVAPDETTCYLVAYCFYAESGSLIYEL